MTSRYGKNKCAAVKVTASFLFAVILNVIYLAIHAVLLLLTYGIEGWDTSVQVDYMHDAGIPDDADTIGNRSDRDIRV